MWSCRACSRERPRKRTRRWRRSVVRLVPSRRSPERTGDRGGPRATARDLLASAFVVTVTPRRVARGAMPSSAVGARARGRWRTARPRSADDGPVACGDRVTVPRSRVAASLSPAFLVREARWRERPRASCRDVLTRQPIVLRTARLSATGRFLFRIGAGALQQCGAGASGAPVLWSTPRAMPLLEDFFF